MGSEMAPQVGQVVSKWLHFKVPAVAFVHSWNRLPPHRQPKCLMFHVLGHTQADILGDYTLRPVPQVSSNSNENLPNAYRHTQTNCSSNMKRSQIRSILSLQFPAPWEQNWRVFSMGFAI